MKEGVELWAAFVSMDGVALICQCSVTVKN